MEQQITEEATPGTSVYTTLYKNAGRNQEISQQQRRDQFLRDQKEKRHKMIDHNRRICEFFLNDLCLEEETMQWKSISPRNKKKKTVFKLMLSEWFTDIPNDLEYNWLAKFVPQGCRVLLIATKGHTNCYNSKGRFYFSIRSAFPGGNQNMATGTTVLDCVYNKAGNVIFVLDCLFWNSMSMLDSEANFRFYWLKGKFADMPELGEYHQYTFILLDSFPAEKTIIQEVMLGQTTVKEHALPYDGVVFYHKESNYFFGYTPLVGWLASYMLPEKLHVDVPPENMVKKPKDYINMEKYLEDLNAKKKALKMKYKKKKSLTLDEEMS